MMTNPPLNGGHELPGFSGTPDISAAAPGPDVSATPFPVAPAQPAPLGNQPTQVYPTTGYPTSAYPAPSSSTASSGLAVTALVLSIVGFIAAVIPFPPFTTIVAALLLIPALILAIIALARKAGGKGMSITALILSGLGGLVATVMAIVLAFVFALLGVAFPFFAEQGRPLTSHDSEPPYSSEVRPNQDAKPAVDLPVRVVEESHGLWDQGDPSFWWYVVVLENTELDSIISDIDISATALDVNGNVLDEDWQWFSMMPGSTAIELLFNTDGTPVDQVVLEFNDGTVTRIGKADQGEIKVDSLKSTPDGIGYLDVTGNLSSTFTREVEYLGVTVVARDAAGKIVSVNTDYVESIPAGSSAPFETFVNAGKQTDLTIEAFTFF